MSQILADMIGGPNDGLKSPVPTLIVGREVNVDVANGTRSLHGQAFGDDLYVFCTLKGRLGWHYAGKVKWTPEELERRKKAAN